MAGNALAAYNIVQPENNAVNNFQTAQTNAINQNGARMQQEAATLEQYAQLGLGVMDGNPDGPINQDNLKQALSLMGDSPLKAKLQENPELLRTITKGSLNVLSQVRDEQKFELAKQQFEQELAAAQAKANAPIEVSAGATLVDPKTKEPIYTAPKVADEGKVPTVVSIYDANGREQKGHMGPVDADHPDGFYPLGSPKADTPRPEFTNSQATAAGYADRMVYSDAILSNPDLATVQTDAVEAGKNGVPFVGNFLTSKEFQQADQAQRDFINAILRRESGAVISDSEFASARKQYFPQPGDSEQVLKQKAANRKSAIRGVARSAGPAYEMPDTTNYLTGEDTVPGGDSGAPPADDGFDPSTMSDEDLLTMLGAH